MDVAAAGAAVRLLPIIAEALGVGVAAEVAREKQKNPPLFMENDEETSSGSESSNSNDGGDSNKQPKEPKDDKEPEWKFGAHKKQGEWDKQMKKRNWTNDEITDTIKEGERFPAQNDVNKGNPAIRYENKKTGNYLVRDEKTKEIIQIGEKNFLRPPAP